MLNGPGPADDGAREGAFKRACERCHSRGEGVTLIWLWRAKKFVCPVCAVHESYEDAIKTVEAAIARSASVTNSYGSPFLDNGAQELRAVSAKLRAQWREQLEGGDPRPLPRPPTR